MTHPKEVMEAANKYAEETYPDYMETPAGKLFHDTADDFRLVAQLAFLAGASFGFDRAIRIMRENYLNGMADWLQKQKEQEN